jgi:creatinine amidohydrolase
VKLAQLSYPEIEARIRRGAVALWPVGSTEAHGPHLPLETDVIIAEETSRLAAERLLADHGIEALILPPLNFAVTELARPFAGTISISPETARAYVRDVVLSASEHGFRAVCLVNGHLEPSHRWTLRDAVKEARERARCPIVIADPADRRFASTVTEELASGSCHAGQYETSLVLAARPQSVGAHRLPKLEIDLVDKIRAGAKSFAEVGADQAYCGDPAAATPEEGRASYVRLSEIVIEVLMEALKEVRR